MSAQDYVEIRHANLSQVLPTTPPWPRASNVTSTDDRLWVFQTCFTAADCANTAWSTIQFARDPCVAALTPFKTVDTTFNNATYDAAQRAFDDQLAKVLDQCPGPWTRWAARVCVPLLHPTLLAYNLTLPALPRASIGRSEHVYGFGQYQNVLATDPTLARGAPSPASLFGICAVAAPFGSPCNGHANDTNVSKNSASYAALAQPDAFFSPNRDAINAPSPYLTLDIFFASDKSHPTPQYLPNLNTTVIPRAWDDATFPTALLTKVENFVTVTACSTANVTVPVLVNGAECDPQTRPCMFHKCSGVGAQCSSSGDLFVNGLSQYEGLQFLSTSSKITGAVWRTSVVLIFVLIAYVYRRRVMAQLESWRFWYQSNYMFEERSDVGADETELPAYDAGDDAAVNAQAASRSAGRLAEDSAVVIPMTPPADSTMAVAAPSALGAVAAPAPTAVAGPALAAASPPAPDGAAAPAPTARAAPAPTAVAAPAPDLPSPPSQTVSAAPAPPVLAAPAPTAAVSSTISTTRHRASDATVPSATDQPGRRPRPSFRSQFGMLAPGLGSPTLFMYPHDNDDNVRRASDVGATTLTTAVDLPEPATSITAVDPPNSVTLSIQPPDLPPDYADVVPSRRRGSTALSTVQFAQDPCVAPLTTFTSADTTFTNDTYDAAQRAFNDQLAKVMGQCPGPWAQWTARTCVPLLHPTLLAYNLTLPALPPASLNKTDHVAAFRQYQEALAANATALLTSSFGICTVAAPLGSPCTHTTSDPYASMGAARQASVVQVDAYYSPNRDAINAPSPNLAVDAFLASDKSHPTPQFLAGLNTTLFPRAWNDDTFPTQLLIKAENYVAVTACSSANVTVPVLVNGAGCDPQLRPCMFHKCAAPGGECSSSGDLFVSGLLTLHGLQFQSTGTKVKQASLQIALSMVILYLIYRYRKKFMDKFNAWHVWYRDGSPMFDPPTDEEAELPPYDDANAVEPPPLPILVADDDDTVAAMPSASATPTPASVLVAPAPTAAIPTTAASYRRRTNSTIALSSLVNLDRQIPSFRSQFAVLEPGLGSSISSLDSRDHHFVRRASDASSTTSVDVPTPPPDYGEIVPSDRRDLAPSLANASAAAPEGGDGGGVGAEDQPAPAPTRVSLIALVDAQGTPGRDLTVEAPATARAA
ncbi:hypothetical protein GGF31_002950 [Allomyces arbusculus]|nr:hypothetical protein GGF31_002950 [Allomyces arbusculus]